MLNDNAGLEPSELETGDEPPDRSKPDCPQLSELDFDVCVEPSHLPGSRLKGEVEYVFLASGERGLADGRH